MRLQGPGLGLLFLTGTALAQDGATGASYRQARAVLEAARVAHGGDRLPKSLSWRLKGQLYARNQNPLPEQNEGRAFSGSLRWDLDKNRFIGTPNSLFREALVSSTVRSSRTIGRPSSICSVAL